MSRPINERSSFLTSHLTLSSHTHMYSLLILLLILSPKKLEHSFRSSVAVLQILCQRAELTCNAVTPLGVREALPPAPGRIGGRKKHGRLGSRVPGGQNWVRRVADSFARKLPAAHTLLLNNNQLCEVKTLSFILCHPSDIPSSLTALLGTRQEKADYISQGHLGDHWNQEAGVPVV